MLMHLRRFREWLEETHSTGFELRRHFFRRFFDSELVSTPGQWRVVAGGAVAIVMSISLVFIQAYYHKYAMLDALPSGEPYRLAVLADVLFAIALSMAIIGLFTTLLWPSLFPGLRDYLAFASLPIRTRDVFVAKFTALLAFAGAFTAATTLLPSVVLAAVMTQHRYGAHAVIQVPAIFISASLAAIFVFFLLVALQGVLLNILPVREFPRISLAIQGVLLTLFLCALPLVCSIPSLQNSMTARPSWAIWTPPVWFLGLDQIIAGNRDPFAIRLAEMGLAGVGIAAAAAITTYLWSYRRHKNRLLLCPTLEKAAGLGWPASLADRLIPNPRELAVFAFVAKTLGRSRQHRMVLTGFGAIALAVIFESIVSLAFSGGYHAISAHTPALRQVIVSAPLALSLFVLCGFRYLFRLPVELRANWVFRMNEPGNRLILLAGVERFLIYCAILPVALITMPFEMRLLGAMSGFVVTLACLLCSFALMELLLMQSEKIPFTSSYLPGRQPLILTVVLYAVAVILYVSILASVVNWCLHSTGSEVALIAALLAVWWKARTTRRDLRQFGQLEFEEIIEPAVQTLSIERH